MTAPTLSERRPRAQTHTHRDRILGAIADASHPITAAQIARVFGCHRRAVSPDLAVFVGRGWVTREPVNPGSSRFQYVVAEPGMRHLQGDERRGNVRLGVRIDVATDKFGGDGGCLLQSLWR